MLYVAELIKSGKKQPEIVNITKKSQPCISYCFRQLKQFNVIEKIGYAVWKVNDEQHKRMINQLKQTPTSFINSAKQPTSNKECRGHAFRFRILLRKNIKNWEKREDYLKSKSIPFKIIQKCNPSFSLRGLKVWLCKRSIVVIYPKSKSFFCQDADRAFAAADADFRAFIPYLEKFLNYDLAISGKYQYTITSNHYGLIRNALAKHYIQQDQKLQVRDENGILRIIIDKSPFDGIPNLMELEGVASEKGADGKPLGVSDTDKIGGFVLKAIKQDKPAQVFDDVSDLKEIVRGQAEVTENVIKNQKYYAENMVSHIKAVQDLGNGVRAFTAVAERLDRKPKQKVSDFWKAVFKNKYRARI
jgi:hypothetical protein